MSVLVHIELKNECVQKISFFHSFSALGGRLFARLLNLIQNHLGFCNNVIVSLIKKTYTLYNIYFSVSFDEGHKRHDSIEVVRFFPTTGITAKKFKEGH